MEDDDEQTEAAVDLVGAVWRAMDAGLDPIAVMDNVEQAIQTWEPDE